MPDFTASMNPVGRQTDGPTFYEFILDYDLGDGWRVTNHSTTNRDYNLQREVNGEKEIKYIKDRKFDLQMYEAYNDYLDKNFTK
jgi:hypothetical protein